MTTECSFMCLLLFFRLKILLRLKPQALIHFKSGGIVLSAVTIYLFEHGRTTGYSLQLSLSALFIFIITN